MSVFNLSSSCLASRSGPSPRLHVWTLNFRAAVLSTFSVHNYSRHLLWTKLSASDLRQDLTFSRHFAIVDPLQVPQIFLIHAFISANFHRIIYLKQQGRGALDPLFSVS